MSFERMDIKNNEVKEGRSCIIIYNFSGKQLTAITNFAGILGVRDKIVLSYKNSGCNIKDILNNNITDVVSDGIKEKAVIFNNISQAKMNVFIENLKKIKINNALMATVTETSKEWTINVLMSNLIEEKKSLKSGKVLKH